jgi:hypothetical protein
MWFESSPRRASTYTSEPDVIGLFNAPKCPGKVPCEVHRLTGCEDPAGLVHELVMMNKHGTSEPSCGCAALLAAPNKIDKTIFDVLA